MLCYQLFTVPANAFCESSPVTTYLRSELTLLYDAGMGETFHTA